MTDRFATRTSVAWTRRQVLTAAFGLSALPSAGCVKHHASVEQCCDSATQFETIPICGFTVLRIGPESGRTILLLHEIPPTERGRRSDAREDPLPEFNRDPLSGDDQVVMID